MSRASSTAGGRWPSWRLSASPLVGRTLKDVVRKYNLLILVHVPTGGAERFLTDIIWPATAGRRCARRLRYAGRPGGASSPRSRARRYDDAGLFAGWMCRTGRMLWRTVSEMDLGVKASTIILLAVLLSGTLVFFLWQSRGIADAFYHTVSIMATVADMGSDRDPDELKVFVSVLRILGAALMAAFTAILTNYLVRASLGIALEVRAFPRAAITSWSAWGPSVSALSRR